MLNKNRKMLYKEEGTMKTSTFSSTLKIVFYIYCIT